MASLSDIPFLGGYTQQNAINRQQGSDELKQATGLMSLQGQMQKQQQMQQAAGKEQALRAELQALGPNATQEQLAGVAAKYAPVGDILKSQTASADRRAQMQMRSEDAQASRDAKLEQAKAIVEGHLEAARQRGVDQQTMKQMELAGRETLVRLAASLRPPRELDKPPSGYRKTAEGNLEAIPGGPADLKVQIEMQKAEKIGTGRETVSGVVAQLRDSYTQLHEGGGISDPSKGTMANLGAGVASSGVGQFVGRMVGTSNQSTRNSIAMKRPLLLMAIKNATGMTAKQLDSNAELKLWLTVATDTTLDIKANLAALENIERLYGGAGGKKPAAPTSNIDSLLEKYK